MTTKDADKVYLVMEGAYSTTRRTAGIFSTRERAEAYIAARLARDPRSDIDPHVFERKLDVGDPPA